MERLSTLDTAFLEAEDADPHVSMAIASIAVFDGPPPDYDGLVAELQARLPLVPRYRQRVKRAPLNLTPPVWVDDPRADIRFHVRRTALPAPGGDDEMFALVARVMAQRLDRDRPLWETWVVEGLADGRWAVISKVHHCMVDGVAGTELYHLLLSPTPSSHPAPPASAPPPLSPPTRGRLTAAALTEAVALPLHAFGVAASAMLRPRQVASMAVNTVRGLLAMTPAFAPVPSTSLAGAIGKQRRYAATVVPLAQVKQVSRRFGVTVNDVALAATTAGFRALLTHRGEVCRQRSIRSLVPVSVRAPGTESDLANHVSCLFADLPVHLADPEQRLAHIHAQVAAAKQRHEAEAGEALVELSAYEPFAVLSPMLRAAFRLPQHSLVTVTTNVPGPRDTLYLMGRPMRLLLPFVPIADRVRTGIAIVSYCNDLAFGVTADYDSVTDVDVLLAGIRRELDVLCAAAACS